MVKNIVFEALFLFFLILLPKSVYAHVLSTDGSIGAILHVDPEDDPVAGEVSSLFFEFKDTQNKFNIQNCDCLVSISEGDKQVYSNSLGADALLSYTFPDKGIYTINVTGKPKDNYSFQPFSLTYSVRSTKDSQNQGLSSAPESNWFFSHIIQLLGIGLVVLFTIFALYKQNNQEGELKE